MLRKPLFITFEGVDGSGKSTQVSMFHSYLQSIGVECVKTKEPGGNDNADKIRALLLSTKDFSPMAQLLLLNAARVEHINQTIYPSLADGTTVICDRFFDSTLAYQGCKMGLDYNLIRKIHKMVCDDLQPDLTFYLAVSPQTATHRIESRDTQFQKDLFQNNWLDTAVVEHLATMIEFYNDLANQNPQRIITIDAESTPNLVFDAIKRSFTVFLS